MPFDFGDVLLVPFPFTDQVTLKQRPAIVVSNVVYNRARLDVVVMAVTGQIRGRPQPGEVLIRAWQVAGLIKPSAIKPVYATLEQRLIIRRLGSLDVADQAALRKAIKETVG